MIQVPNGKVPVTIMAQPDVTKPRLEGGMIEIKFNVTIVKDRGTCPMSAWTLEVLDL